VTDNEAGGIRIRVGDAAEGTADRFVQERLGARLADVTLAQRHGGVFSVGNDSSRPQWRPAAQDEEFTVEIPSELKGSPGSRH
jgi:hypothetical protein